MVAMKAVILKSKGIKCVSLNVTIYGFREFDELEYVVSKSVFSARQGSYTNIVTFKMEYTYGLFCEAAAFQT